MTDRIYPGSASAPAQAGAPPYGARSDQGQSPTPGDGGSGTGDPASSPPTSAPDGGGGLISAGNDGDSGLGVNIVDTDGNDDGLINVDSGLTSGVDALDGLTVDAVTPDHLVDAHVPGLLDATVDNPGLLDGIGDAGAGDVVGGVSGAGGLLGGDGLTVEALGDNLLEINGNPVLGDVLGGSGPGGAIGSVTDGLNLGGVTDGLTGGLLGGDGITVEALNGDNIAEVHVPGVADVTVGGAELANIGDVGDAGGLLGSGDGLLSGLTGGSGDGITVEVLNGQNIAEAHAPGIADITVGGAELGQILGGLGASDVGGIGGDSISVDVLNGDSIVDVHVPDTADVTVGSDIGDGSANLAHLLG